MLQANDQQPEINVMKDADGSYKKTNQSKWTGAVTIVVAEFVGTALMVFITCMGCTKGIFGEEIPVMQISLAGGLSVATVIQIFGHISGAQINPGVTLCAAIIGEIAWTSVPIYIAAQTAGSLTGYALLVAATPDKYLDVVDGGHCVTSPHPEISLLQACLVEFMATFIMVMAICASWDPRNCGKADSVPLKIGFIVFLLGITAGAYTGASMNPARSLGPALWNGKWSTHWIYWVAPILGATFAGQFYKTIFLRNIKSIVF